MDERKGRRKTTMNLYKLEQNENLGYDTFSHLVVCAETAEDARLIHPDGIESWKDEEPSWAFSPQNVKATLIGKAVADLRAGTIVCYSFHAG